MSVYVILLHADINECVQNTSLCQQLCINTDGGYTCSCRSGYQLIEGTNQCQGTAANAHNKLTP